MKIKMLALAIMLSTAQANADNSTRDAAIGGGIGGAAGAALGNEIGGRDGAIIGGALGGAVGAAVNTDKEQYHSRPSEKPDYNNVHYHERHDYDRPSKSRFCPPGQAKKGRC